MKKNVKNVIKNIVKKDFVFIRSLISEIVDRESVKNIMDDIEKIEWMR